MLTGFSIALSIAALAFSIYVFFNNRRLDKRDNLIKMHELLISERQQRGRYLLHEKVRDESSVEHLSPEDYRDINSAISALSLLGLYVTKGYVNEQDALGAWAGPVARAWEAAKPFLAHRENRQGYNPHRWFEPLAQKSREYLDSNGIPFKYVAWRRAADKENPSG
jgi:hypothetical protein